MAEKLVIRAEHLNQELRSLCEMPNVQIMRAIIASRKGEPIEMQKWQSAPGHFPGDRLDWRGI
ncbi:MAG: hypothetical protein M9950_07395 [Thermomicrobiales bacterium]|nr:hypothetical protein [Thermomicrobiales bacterium]